MREGQGWETLSARDTGLDWERLNAYAAELERWNRTIRLVGPRDLAGVRVQIEDALLPFLLCRPLFPLLDIGSGAGLPGLAIAAGFTGDREGPEGSSIVCLEPLGKRVSFLRHAARHLGLEGVEVLEERAETAVRARPDLRGRFRTVTARAVAEGGQLLALAEPYLAEGGRVVLPRGDEAPSDRAGWRLAREVLYEGPPGVGPRKVHVYERAA